MDDKLINQLYQRAQEFYIQGKTLDALGILTQLSLECPRNIQVIHGRALCLTSLRRFDEALAACDHLATLGMKSEAESLRTRIAEYQVNAEVKSTLLAQSLLLLHGSPPWRRLVAQHAALGVALACCLVIGVFIGLWYGAPALAAGPEMPMRDTIIKYSTTPAPALDAVATPAGILNNPLGDANGLNAESLAIFSGRHNPSGAAPQLTLETSRGRLLMPAIAHVTLDAARPDEPGSAHADLAVSSLDAARVLLQFDVPVRRIEGINRAELVLDLLPPAENLSIAPVQLEVYRILSLWNETGATWNQAPPTDARPCAVFKADPGTPGALRADITALAQDWLNGAPNYGILLKAAPRS